MEDPATAKGTKEPNEEENANFNTDAEQVGVNAASKVDELVRVLDDYFEHDADLRKQYKDERPITDLYILKLVNALQPDIDALLAAIKRCKKLDLDASGNKVRANIGEGRTILILRDLPRDVKHENIRTLLENKELTAQLEGRVMEIRPELNDTWFVRFGSQDDCMAAFWWLRTKGKINGKTVKCRVKSVLQSTTYNPGSHPTGDSYPANNGYRGGYTPQNFYPGYGPGPGYSPMMPYGSAPGAGYQQRGGRRSNGRRGKNGRYGNAGGGDRGGRHQTVASSPNFRPSNNRRPAENKAPRGGRASTSEENQNIHYPAQFVMIERQSFDQIVKSCRNMDSNEPTKPQEILKFEKLITDKVKYGFDLTPLSQGNTISPMPVPQQSPQEPDALSLDGATKTTTMTGKQLITQVKKSLAMDKKKEAIKKVGKNANAATPDDQKEEEVSMADPTSAIRI